MYKFAPLLTTCLIGFSLAGCASLTGSDKKQAEPTTPPPAQSANKQKENIEYADFEPEVLYLLLSGEIAAQRGRYDITLVNYLQAAKISRDKGVIARAMRIAQSLNGDNAQQQLANLWLEVEPDSLEAHRVAAIQAVKRNELEAALGHMEQLMGMGADADFDALALMARNLPPERQAELLNLYKELSQRYPDSVELDYSTALLLKMSGNTQEALDRINGLMDDNPNFQPGIVLRGDLLYESGKKRKALDYLLTNTRRFPSNRQMGTLYGRMLISEGDLRAAQDEFDRLINEHPDVPGLRLSHALVAIENRENDLAREDLTQLIEEGHHINEANYYLGRIEDSEGNIQPAINYYSRVEGGDFYFSALARKSALLAGNDQLDEAVTDIRNLRGENPAQDENYRLLEVNLLMEHGQEEQALDSASEAVGLYPENIQIRYARAMLLDMRGQTEPAEEDLKLIINQDPGNSVALNALGYILTTKTNRLDEARNYIERALALDPENPAILDSMGWVLFKEGELESALDYLARAWSDYTDPEIAAHYGEALWVSGAREQARIIWKEGLEKDPDHEILRETIQRLTQDSEL
ncbi:tetratricopeptide repeat protein [Marinobacter salinisoli]|uniref:Tetratricopeptide repeat protein n=1 Tax=Marinobacter salinisoli TaxID=2769486 RepID=A0ABX7MV42_9GAMM|nr:tetratricopeptide repeat protein [Marinobacter salinisoli]QSP96247.1 tetratricopeptide repeat protein [Marinobacter salinisoli]